MVRTLKKTKKGLRHSVWSGKGGNQQQDIEVLARLDQVKQKFNDLIDAMVKDDNTKEKYKEQVKKAIEMLITTYNEIIEKTRQNSQKN